ncbi:MAG: hypothetical protein JKY49_00390 [Cohaesibacteraceae bacterium]|nr:hypothetical protein [Cohaesibacteraceae bacterium]MBL4875756.1 hypothetical protein [Cohaesibacteraceae bacterium]
MGSDKKFNELSEEDIQTLLGDAERNPRNAGNLEVLRDRGGRLPTWENFKTLKKREPLSVSINFDVELKVYSGLTANAYPSITNFMILMYNLVLVVTVPLAIWLWWAGHMNAWVTVIGTLCALVIFKQLETWTRAQATRKLAMKEAYPYYYALAHGFFRFHGLP